MKLFANIISIFQLLKLFSPKKLSILDVPLISEYFSWGTHPFGMKVAIGN